MEDLIKAFQIFFKYDNPNYPTHCEHDVMYVNIDPSIVSIDDISELRELGFNVDSELNNFRSFKYGSY